MYEKINEFCKVKNNGNVHKNGDSPTPRVQFLMNLLESNNIEYVIDKFPIESRISFWDRNKDIDFDFDFDFEEYFRRRKRKRRDEFDRRNESTESKNYGFNLILKGSSNKMVVAHHDIVNKDSDNANDNSASVINAIAVKKLIPDLNVVLLDGEESGGLGSKRCSTMIKEGYFGNIKWVLNLELTGKGGKYFFIGNYPGELFNHIKSLFECPVVDPPFNDSINFRMNGIDSCVINTLPVAETPSSVKWDENTFLDYKMLFNCHSFKDSLSSISTSDMKEFVENVLVKILK